MKIDIVAIEITWNVYQTFLSCFHSPPLAWTFQSGDIVLDVYQTFLSSSLSPYLSPDWTVQSGDIVLDVQFVAPDSDSDDDDDADDEEDSLPEASPR